MSKAEEAKARMDEKRQKVLALVNEIIEVVGIDDTEAVSIKYTAGDYHVEVEAIDRDSNRSEYTVIKTCHYAFK